MEASQSPWVSPKACIYAISMCFGEPASLRAGSCHLFGAESEERVGLSRGLSWPFSQLQLSFISSEAGWEQVVPHSQGPGWNKAACESKGGIKRTHKSSTPHPLEVTSILAMVDGQSMSLSPFSRYLS